MLNLELDGVDHSLSGGSLLLEHPPRPRSLLCLECCICQAEWRCMLNLKLKGPHQHGMGHSLPGGSLLLEHP